MRTHKESRDHNFKCRKNRLLNGKCRHCSNPRIETSTLYCENHYFVEVAKKRLGKGTNETAQELKHILEGQNYICPYTGDKLIIGLNCHLDHKYPIKRFPELKSDINNVEWVSSKVNLAKRDMTKEEFICFIKKIIMYIN